MTSLLKHVDLGQPWLIASVGTVLFNPIFWNIVARNGESSVRLLCFSLLSFLFRFFFCLLLFPVVVSES
jgi:inner membrane protein involved in colicin E2 resistance